MFAPTFPAQHPTLAPHHLPLGIHPPATPPSPHMHGQFPNELLRSTSPAVGPDHRLPAAADFVGDQRSMPMDAVTKHPKLRLQLTLGADCFEAGGAVHGRMEVCSLTGKGMRIGEIAVELEAAEELHSRDHSARQTFLYARTLFQGAHLPPSNAVTPHAPITTSSHTHSGTTVWWNSRKGKTTFPFSFPVPVRAPSSVSFAGNASLRYVLKGTAQIWVASQTSSTASPHDQQHQQRHLITVRAEVPVVERWPVTLARSLPSHPLFHEPIDVVADTRLFLGGNGAVWLEAGLLRSIFLSGSEVHLKLSVRNNTKRHVSGVKVSLARRLVFPVQRSDELEPGGPGALLRPPGKTTVQEGNGQQPMITEVVSEQSFKTTGSTSSHAGANYEFPPNEETVCVLPVRIPHDLRTVGLGVPCGPEHGGEGHAATHAKPHHHHQDIRHTPGSGWSGRSLLFEVQVVLRVALPLGALSKDLTVEIPIWVVHPRSVGAEGIKVLMEARDLALQNPLHQLPRGPDAQHNDASRPKHRQSLDSHSQAYQDVNVQRPHSSAGHHQQPGPMQQFGNLAPQHYPGPGQAPPYQLPVSPSPHSLAPMQQYAIERGWSPAPMAPGMQLHQMPSIVNVMPARPASAMDSYRPPPPPLSPAPAPGFQYAPGMMVAVPQIPMPISFGAPAPHMNGGNGAEAFVFDPNAPDWRASRMFVSPEAAAAQYGSAIPRSASAAPDVGSNLNRQDTMASFTTFANLPPPVPQQQVAAPPQPFPGPPERRASFDQHPSSQMRRVMSGPLPLPGSTIVEAPREAQDSQQEPPRPCPSPGPGRDQRAQPKHKHVPTPPASMLSDSRPSGTASGASAGSASAPAVAAPAAQRAPPTPTDVYAQLAMHSHSRMLSEVPEEGDEDDHEHEHEHDGHETGSVPIAGRPIPGSMVSLGRAPSRLESQSPAPSRSLDIAALENLADQSGSKNRRAAPNSSSVQTTPVLQQVEDRSQTPKAETRSKSQVPVAVKSVTPGTPSSQPRLLGRSSSSMSVSSQGAGLAALEARLARPMTPLASAPAAVEEATPKADDSTRAGSRLPETSYRNAVPAQKESSPPRPVEKAAATKPRNSAPAKYSAILADETDDEDNSRAKVVPAAKKAQDVKPVAIIKPISPAIPQAQQPIRVYGNIAPAAEGRRRSVDETVKKPEATSKTKVPVAPAAVDREQKREDRAVAERERMAQEAIQRADASKAAREKAQAALRAESAKASALPEPAKPKAVELRDVPAATRAVRNSTGSSALAQIRAIEQRAESASSMARQDSGRSLLADRARDDASAAPKPMSVVRDKRLSLPATAKRPEHTGPEDSKYVPVPSAALRSVKQQVQAVQHAKVPSEAEKILNKRRESLKKVDPATTPSQVAANPSSGNQREAEQRVLGKKAVDRVAGWLTEAASPPTSSLDGIFTASKLGGSGGQLEPKVEMIVRRVSAFDMIEAVNTPKTPSSSVLIAYKGSSQPVKALPVPGSSSSASGSGGHHLNDDAPTMAELLAASGIQPRDKEQDGESAMGSVNTFKPKARLAGSGGAPALDFSNVSTCNGGVTKVEANRALANSLAPPPSGAIRNNKTAAVVAAFEISSGKPRRSVDGHEAVKITTPKIKPLKGPTAAGVFLNSATPHGIFSSQSSSSAAVEAEVPAAGSSKVHPYSALALRPTRRQSVDFKGRAAAFEGNTSNDSGGETPIVAVSNVRHRPRASVDVVRLPPSAWDVGVGASAATATAAPVPVRASSSGSVLPASKAAVRSPTMKTIEADSWQNASSSRALAPPAATSTDAHAGRDGATAEGLKAPTKRDGVTVDGRGTTKAIGSNRLRELRSVWGS
ncbi:unnamed protein product [Tilletia controversa]|uniref:Arrestin C-terminal-like domain-containing protein n=3 Tax=Tilletia TaxID=13289 RepID=A0A8X7SX14_9BASI|nr:hypothetical protein CF336_g3704 [Tilletia laevis]KAE8197933.1 hypothetical protein CF328_g3698 [Tilletia controversa]KAE8261427.1 hypothetical protein A4X03_0g3262 [Tilletia caries]KAE8203043.1 hypothetical protein CF335_g3185 [Tilletia laevis]KAE8247755.1 hypothetical protein A4X06_0g4215 [Tilletia controversa]